MKYEEVLQNAFDYNIGSCGSSLNLIKVTYVFIEWSVNNQIDSQLLKKSTLDFINALAPEDYNLFCYTIDSIESEVDELFNPEADRSLLLSSAGCPDLPQIISSQNVKSLLMIIKESIDEKNEADLIEDKPNSAITNLSLGLNGYLDRKEESRQKKITERIRKQYQEINELQELHKRTEVDYSKLESKIKQLERRYQNNVAVLISILAIFSGVIMVFFGGLKLFDNTMQNLTSNNDFKVVFLAALISLVIFNAIVYLLNLIKQSSLGEPFEVVTSKESSFEKSFPYFKIVNKVIIIIIFLFLILYLFDIIDISQYIKIIPRIHK